MTEQLLLSDKYGIINDTNELANPKLFHAKTGAAMSRDLFGVPEEIAREDACKIEHDLSEESFAAICGQIK